MKICTHNQKCQPQYSEAIMRNSQDEWEGGILFGRDRISNLRKTGKLRNQETAWCISAKGQERERESLTSAPARREKNRMEKRPTPGSKQEYHQLFLFLIQWQNTQTLFQKLSREYRIKEQHPIKESVKKKNGLIIFLHFAKLLTAERAEYQETLQPQSDIQIRTAASPLRINTKEVKQICQTLKSRKSPGPGEIPLELLKYGTDKLYKQFASLFQKCLNGENIPKEWKTSYITTIHKKGSKDDCDNYRGISVLSSVSRVYGKLVKKRIEEEYRDMEAEEQAGFRAGRSTVDHLFTLTQIIEKKMARNQEIHLLYVDLKKAYDSVPQSKLWEALEKTNISITLIKAVQELYKNNTSQVKKGQTVLKGFSINKGLKKGCCLLPTLFKIYLEQALKMWKRKKKGEQMEIPLNDSILYTLCFADDQIILAQDY
ncbi:uncharacterized protein LOC115889574 [Sitophilus oryzae]|uniref:Uncharacterized protein LOC115889574 n=1 Tax=Sitophilus oryzae TaxID=7048 RepID=A0A6J2YQ71_SITOR|nr:uncharacterized protein LOC115889574 [Sitophilus oryzae]